MKLVSQRHGIDNAEPHKQPCRIKDISLDIEIIMIVTQSKHLPLCPSSSATLDGRNCKETGTVLKLSDADRGAYTIKIVTSREPETFNRLAHSGLYLALK